MACLTHRMPHPNGWSPAGEDDAVTSRPACRRLLRCSLLVVLGASVLLTVASHHRVGAGPDRYFSPCAVAVSPDGTQAYVSGKTLDEVAVVDLGAGKVAATIAGVKGPTGLALSPDGATLYAAGYQANSVAIVDVKGKKVTGRINVGKRPSGLALTADGSRLYVCNRMSDDVSIVDPAAKKELARVPAVRE
ncbi:MAG: hypothetical protein FJX74_26130, partial [Armatimonadetes bacterium]|nr:hypothetical protein [Armatimonadota bacterium]